MGKALAQGEEEGEFQEKAHYEQKYENTGPPPEAGCSSVGAGAQDTSEVAHQARKKGKARARRVFLQLVQEKCEIREI